MTDDIILTPELLRYIVSTVAHNTISQIVAEQEVTLAVLKTSRPTIAPEIKEKIDALFKETKRITELDLKENIRNLVEKAQQDLAKIRGN